jgi:L-tartrate/succinate antiporter
MNLRSQWRMFVPLFVFALIWIMPSPQGLSIQAWHFLAVFFAVLVGLVLEPIPAALLGLIGISVASVLGLVGKTPAANIKWALSGFSNNIIWLIFASIMFAMGYKKTGLGKRISLIMVKYMGKSTLGLGYAIAFADLVLAPFMPSNTARSAGTIYPIAINIPILFNSTPENEPRKMGAYLVWVGIAISTVTSSMFYTGLTTNMLAADLIQKGANITLEWGAWAKIMIPLMLPLFLITPLLAYVIFPPTQKHSPSASFWAQEELMKMGSITFKEMMMASFATFALILWVFGKELNVDATVAAISIVALMVLSNIITWDDVIGNKGAWNVLVWFATLVALAAGLKEVGILTWISQKAELSLMGLTPTMLMISMIVASFVLHYFFASLTAHAVALFPIFIAFSVKFISPEQLVTFLILFSGTLGVMGIITPYGTGPSPIWYGSGYISQGRWWFLGAIFGGLYLGAILLGVFIFF